MNKIIYSAESWNFAYKTPYIIDSPAKYLVGKKYFERGKIILGKTYYTIHQELKPDDYLRTKELSFSHKFKFSNPYIFATRW